MEKQKKQRKKERKVKENEKKFDVWIEKLKENDKD